jgi:hypothetical protein
MQTQQKETKSNQLMVWGLYFASFCLLMPVLGLMGFSFPFSDDFANADWVKKDGVIDANLACYMGWGGRYFSNLMLGVANPLAYTDEPVKVLWIYRLHSLVLLIVLLFSFRLLLSRLLPQNQPVTLLTIFTVSLGTTFIGNGFEWLYWLAGSYTYCLGFSFTLLCIYFLLEDRFSENTPSNKALVGVIFGVGLFLAIAWVFRKPIISFLNPRPDWFLVAILGLVVGLYYVAARWETKPGSRMMAVFMAILTSGMAIGSSEIFLFILVPLAGLLGIKRFWETQKFPWMDGLIILGFAITSGLAVFSPSTQSRRNLQSRNLPDFDLGNWEKVESVIRYFSSLPLLAGMLILAIWWLNRFNNSHKTPAKPKSANSWLIHVFFGLSLVYICIVIPLGLSKYASLLPDRAKNPLFFLALFVSLLWIDRLRQNFRNSRNFLLPLSFVLILSSLPATKGPGFWKGALDFLLSGDGPKSNALHVRQLQQISECQEDTCYISTNPFHPLELLGEENAILPEDPPSWKNYKSYSFAQYFGKKFIGVKPVINSND